MEKFNKVGVSQEKLMNRSYIFFFTAIDGKKGTINIGQPEKGTTAQVTITIDDDDLVDLAAGKANAPAVCINYLNLIYIYNIIVFLAFCKR